MDKPTPNINANPRNADLASNTRNVVESESWRSYGFEEKVTRRFIDEFSGKSTDITSIDITSDGALDNPCSFNDKDELWNFLTAEPISTSISLRIFAVKSLSAEALQIMSTALGIHLAFWAWVASDQATDGFWQNTHNNGKSLSFDFPSIELYSTTSVPTVRVVREGRLKQLSSLHRFFSTGLEPAKIYDIYVNRRVSVLMIPISGYHAIIYLSEDSRAVSSHPLISRENTELPSTEWLLELLQTSDPDVLMDFAQEPVGLLLKIIRRMLASWHVFTNQIHRDMDEIDARLPDRLPAQISEQKLFDLGTFLHRDVLQTVYRFNLHLSKFEMFLTNLTNGSGSKFRPKKFAPEVVAITNNVTGVRRRLDACKDRGNMALTLINNYITHQQARNAHEQALISARMVQIQVRDSQGSSRLSIVATVFLPLSFSISWLSTNSTTPLWVFFAISAVSLVGTVVIIMTLKWIEKERESGPLEITKYFTAWRLFVSREKRVSYVV